MHAGNKHIGSSLDDLLADDGALASVSATARERITKSHLATGKRDPSAEISDGFSSLVDARAAKQETILGF